MSSARIVLTEVIHDRGLNILHTLGDVIVPKSLDEGSLCSAVANADALVVRGLCPIPRKIMECAPRLRVIGRHGAGVENVDVAAATELGIWVVNTPNAPSESLAEHFLLLALALCRQMRQAERWLRRGEWGSRNNLAGIELQGRTVGIVGLGRTGRLIAQKCRCAFQNRILYYDVQRAAPEIEADLGVEYRTLDALLAESDLVTLQVPLTEQTRHLISTEQIACMKPTAFLLNLCRGPVWDEGAVLRALIDRRIAGAATDVFEVEPPGRVGQTLLQLTNFIATPHIGGLTEEAMERMSLVAEDIARVLAGQQPQWRVNDPPHPRA